MIEPGGQHTASPSRESAPDQGAGRAELPPPAPEPDWGGLLQQTADMGGDIMRLFVLELRLALNSLKRMLMLSVAILPVILLVWIGLSALPGVMLYEYSGSLTSGVACFVLVQVLALWALRMAFKRYRRSLGLPLTREQLRQFRGSTGSET